MASLSDPRHVAETMLSWLGLSLISCAELQTLWAGYGHICAIKARANSRDVEAQLRTVCDENVYCSEEKTFRLILKFVSPQSIDGSDEGHLRKILSYEVEQYFYDYIAPQLGPDTAVAKCLASTRTMYNEALACGLGGVTATVMTDLRPAFPVAGEKRAVLSTEQTSAALRWLATFHRSYWKAPLNNYEEFLLPPLEEMARRETAKSGAKASTIWLNGGYTYLATRRREYGLLVDDKSCEWSTAFCSPFAESRTGSVAEVVAEFLTPKGREFETYIHGDVKSENLFSTKSGDRVAFFDFQYVGLGLGVCDLAKLFTCSIPMGVLVGSNTVGHELTMCPGEERLLRQYRSTLLKNPGCNKDADYPLDVFVRHWECALVDWCRFQASWGFWGNVEWLQARTRAILKDESWRQWLLEASLQD